MRNAFGHQHIGLGGIGEETRAEGAHVGDVRSASGVQHHVNLHLGVSEVSGAIP